MNILANRLMQIIILALILSLGANGCADDHEQSGENHDHDEHEGEDIVKLSPKVMQEFGIEVRAARTGTIALSHDLPGEIVLNPDRVTHVVPRVPGVVAEVRVTVGDHVEKGQVMAMLVSRELAQTKSSYLAALSQIDLATADFQRARKLRDQNITSEAEYLAAQQSLREAKLNVRLAERELYALGLSEQELSALPEQPSSALAHYVMKAPAGGDVIERHLTAGEVLREDSASPPFVIANLSNVWVYLTVYPKDLMAVQAGQEVVINAGQGLEATGSIDYISPVLGEATRTATARVVLANPAKLWRPGMFVTGRVQTGEARDEIVVPKTALQEVNGQQVVFLQVPEGFEPQPVKLGRSDRTHAQIVAGLKPGDEFIATGAFTLKAEMLKSTFGDGHAH